MSIRVYLLPVFFAVGVSACGSSDEKSSSVAPTLDGLIHNTVFDENNQVVAGVQICAEGDSQVPCVTTNALGIGDLAVPLDQAMTISYSKTDFVTKRRQLLSSEDLSKGLGIWLFQRKAWYQQVATDLGVSIDFGKGLVELETAADKGATFDLQPASGVLDAGIQQAQFNLDQKGKLGACVAGETCDPGTMEYFDVPPGRYTGTVQVTGMVCMPRAFACADGSPGCAEIEVVAGQLAQAYVACK